MATAAEKAALDRRRALIGEIQLKFPRFIAAMVDDKAKRVASAKDEPHLCTLFDLQKGDFANGQNATCTVSGFRELAKEFDFIAFPNTRKTWAAILDLKFVCSYCAEDTPESR